MHRRSDTKRITVGGVPVGGGAPISVQSMTNVKTDDIAAVTEQMERLKNAGCDIARVAVPDMEAARAIAAIKTAVDIPVVADIHFDYRLAVEAVSAGADKIRINPGNIGGDDKVKAVADACRSRGIPIRIGVNAGSLEKELLAKYGEPVPEAMVESAKAHIELLHRFDFDDICLSLKASSVRLTVAAYQLAAQCFEYPLHLGITEAGILYSGLVKSAAGLGAQLTDGIGDTIRVSLTADPVEEVRAGIEILKALDLRGGFRLISCPSCGRCGIDLIRIAGEVESALSGLRDDVTVAVMGCSVNGPGEARRADYGIAGGKDTGILFKKGEIVAKIPADKLVAALINLMRKDNYQLGEINDK